MHNYTEEILIDDEYLNSLLIAIYSAKYSIDIEVYIFANDYVGELVAETLCKAASRGVKIRILVDGIGSMGWGDRLTNQLEAYGIETRIFHPFPLKFSHWHRTNIITTYWFSKIIYALSKINSRNHRKICIIDKKIVFAGSSNISNMLLDSNLTGKKWHEINLKLVNVDIVEIQYAFELAWSKILSRKKWHKPITKNNLPPIFHLNYSWHLRHRYYKSLLLRIVQCRTRIWVINSYFVPDHLLLTKLIQASRRGVDVRILLPGKSDVKMISLVTATFYAQLIQSGVTIYEYEPAILHAKVLILDDCYMIGSNNLNYRSFRHDLEVNIEIQTVAAKKKLEQQFLSDLNCAKQMQLSEVKKYSIFKRIAAYFILFIRNWI